MTRALVYFFYFLLISYACLALSSREALSITTLLELSGIDLAGLIKSPNITRVELTGNVFRLT